MPRFRCALAAFSMFVFAIPAAAGSSRGAFSNLVPRLSQRVEGGRIYDCLSVEGQTRYPQGTVFQVGVRPEKSAEWIWNTQVTVHAGRTFVIEFPPNDRRLAAGHYVVAIQFRMDRQPAAVRTEIEGFEEFGACVDEDPAKLAELTQRDPERAKRYLAEIKANGHCPMHDQVQEVPLAVGTAEEIDRASENEDADLRGAVDFARDHLLRAEEYAATDTAAEAWTAWEQELSQVEEQVLDWTRHKAWSRRKLAWSRVEGAIYSLRRLADAVRAQKSGASDLADLDAAAAAGDRDARRRAEQARSRASIDARDRGQAERDTLSSLADALYGPSGLTPAPARARAWADDLRRELNLEWTWE
jgi:hypothetical protein